MNEASINWVASSKKQVVVGKTFGNYIPTFNFKIQVVPGIPNAHLTLKNEKRITSHRNEKRLNHSTFKIQHST